MNRIPITQKMFFERIEEEEWNKLINGEINEIRMTAFILINEFERKKVNLVIEKITPPIIIDNEEENIEDFIDEEGSDITDLLISDQQKEDFFTFMRIQDCKEKDEKKTLWTFTGYISEEDNEKIPIHINFYQEINMIYYGVILPLPEKNNIVQVLNQGKTNFDVSNLLTEN